MRVLRARTVSDLRAVGSSPEGVDQAVRNAISRASQTLRNLDWFEVTQVRGRIENGRIEDYQVGLKVGFRLEEGD
ncbi:dodecin [Streptomyces sp. NPDC001215]